MLLAGAGEFTDAALEVGASRIPYGRAQFRKNACFASAPGASDHHARSVKRIGKIK
jgi:hypothetical protein